MSTDALYTGGVVAVALAAVELGKMAISAVRNRNGKPPSSFNDEDRKTVRAIHEGGLVTNTRILSILERLPGDIRDAVREGMRER